MTVQNDVDFDRTMTAWLGQEAPTRAPEFLLGDVLDATTVIRPGRGWLARLDPAGKSFARARVLGTRAAAVVAVAAMISVILGLVIIAGTRPHNGLLAYTTLPTDEGSFAITVVSPDGTAGRPLVVAGDLEQLQCPVFSPDGGSIAFVGGQAAELEVIGVDGSGRRRVGGHVSFQGPTGSSAIAWSPDGTRIAYGLDTMATDQTGPPNIVEIATVADGSAERIKFPEIEYVTSVAWSSDGTRLLVVGTGGNTTQDHDRTTVLTVRPDGSQRSTIATFSTGASGPSGTSAWSPDGSRILVVQPAISSPLSRRATVIPVDGSAPTIVSPEGVAVNDAAWSPDGRSIAMSGTNADGSPALFVTAPDGSGARSLDAGFKVSEIAWSPDSARLLMVPAFDQSGLPDPWPRSIAADGTAGQVIYAGASGGCPPSWQPLPG